MIYVLIPTTKERRPRLEKLLESLRANDFPYVACIYENLDGGVGAALHKMLEGINGLSIVLADDQTVAPDFFKVLYAAYTKAFPNNEGIAQFNDVYSKKPIEKRLTNGPLCPAYMYRKYWYKGYIHDYADKEFTNIIKLLGIPYIFVEEAKVYHHHWVEGQSEYDATYALTHQHTKRDKQLYREREAAGFMPRNE